MQPYQRASQEISRQSEMPLTMAKNVGGAAITAGSALAGGALVGRVLPFLSKYIPESLAIAGLTKIDPRLGKFISKAKSEGEDFESIKNSIKEKISEEEERNPAKENRNIIEQYSPELYQTLKEKIQGGLSPIVAGFQAKGDKKFDNAIRKMEKDHGVDWSAILDTVFGGTQQAQQQGQSVQQQVPQQMQQTQRQQQNGQSSAADTIAQAIQAYTQMRGNRGS